MLPSTVQELSCRTLSENNIDLYTTSIIKKNLQKLGVPKHVRDPMVMGQPTLNHYHLEAKTHVCF